MVLFCNLFIE